MGRELDHLQKWSKSHRENNRAVVVCYLLLTNNTLRRLPCPFDDDCSAGRPHRCAWRACSRRPYRHVTCKRRIDAKASSDEAVIDVEVDRCIDENSASNHAKEALLVRLSPKLHRSTLFKND